MKTEEFDSWFASFHSETCYAISMRAALRCLPAAFSNWDGNVENRIRLTLSSIRMLLALVASMNERFLDCIKFDASKPTELERIANYSMSSGHMFTKLTPENNFELEIRRAASAGRNLAELLGYLDTDELKNSISAPVRTLEYLFGAPALELALDDSRYSPKEMLRHKLLDNSRPIDRLEKFTANFFEVCRDNREWSFWREWYQGFLDGKPLDWELQKEIALIPDADWEKGPEWIAEKIEKIRLKYRTATAPRLVRDTGDAVFHVEAEDALPLMSLNFLASVSKGFCKMRSTLRAQTGCAEIPMKQS